MAGVIPDTLRSQVLAAIGAAATIDGPVTSATTLASLGISNFVAESLAGPFTRIAQQFAADAEIGRSDCGNLTTVADAVALVARAAGFGGP